MHPFTSAGHDPQPKNRLQVRLADLRLSLLSFEFALKFAAILPLSLLMNPSDVVCAAFQ